MGIGFASEIYIDKFNKFLNRAFRYGYTQNKYSMAKMIEERDRLLFNKVMHNPEHCLYELLPEKRQRPLRERDHQFMLPMVYTERFKQSFLNKYLSMILLYLICTERFKQFLMIFKNFVVRYILTVTLTHL
jgi:hypothetical protein